MIPFADLDGEYATDEEVAEIVDSVQRHFEERYRDRLVAAVHLEHWAVGFQLDSDKWRRVEAHLMQIAKYWRAES